MKNITLNFLIIFALIFAASCNSNNSSKGEITQLRFIDEYVIPDGTMFENTLVGGLSGLDYNNGTWAFISDGNTAPIRFYTATMNYDSNGFNSVKITYVKTLKDKNNVAFTDGSVDPESIRFTNNGFIWTNEGNINNRVNSSIRFANSNGNYLSEIILADKFNISKDTTKGPRHNGVFEGISVAINNKGYWAAMELPLVQDGLIPSLDDTNSPVRIAYITNNGEFGKEFAYELDTVARKASDTSFTVNGLVEIIEYNNNQFLVLERSYSTGFSDGGNNVKIYKANANNATDISNIESLNGATYTKATKTLLFDLESVRSQLTNGIVDNIEGITFGPKLENGNRSIVLVADNNFSAFGPQLNQFILLEVLD